MTPEKKDEIIECLTSGLSSYNYWIHPLKYSSDVSGLVENLYVISKILPKNFPGIDRIIFYQKEMDKLAKTENRKNGYDLYRKIESDRDRARKLILHGMGVPD